MKTKIIYISGSEVFDVADIRAAFNEVRNTLCLASDTVLFGVPVDKDDAGMSIKSTSLTNTLIPEVITDTLPLDTAEEITDNAPYNETVQESAIKAIEDTLAPVQKKITMRKPRVKISDNAAIEPIAPQTSTDEEVIETATIQNEIDEDTVEKIIPILSILASKSESIDVITEQNTDPVSIYQDSVTTAEIEIPAPIIINDCAESEINYEDTVVTENVTIEQVKIGDIDFESDIFSDEEITSGMITDDAPVAEQEKTLEQLFAKMTPLREDHIVEDIRSDEMNTDATLAQLASEFAEKEDDIISMPKAETSGKIGKLKNILPFKKAKREDTGLMGDLFGWAGIAANDEEFSIPGFFTTAASKK